MTSEVRKIPTVHNRGTWRLMPVSMGIEIAVGTVIADRSPHRSKRAPYSGSCNGRRKRQGKAHAAAGEGRAFNGMVEGPTKVCDEPEAEA